jgi:hypothetical protein
MEYLQQMEDRMHADNVRVEELIEWKCREHCDKLRWELGSSQNNGNMLRAALLVVILVLVFYFSGFSGPRSTKLMLKWQLLNKFGYTSFCDFEFVRFEFSVFLLVYSSFP